MRTADLDIVIPLKPDPSNEELRYMLRSISKNLPHRYVFLAGYMPDWVDNVSFVSTPEPEGSKYSIAGANIRAACADKRVSHNFILMADDIFVLHKTDNILPYHRGAWDDYKEHYEGLVETDLSHMEYLSAMRLTEHILRRLGHAGPILNYQVHAPFILNKRRRLEITRLQRLRNPEGLSVHSNTLYGNFFALGGQYIDDPKIKQLDVKPKKYSRYVSTSNESFSRGLVGSYIRELFPKPCRYEK